MAYTYSDFSALRVPDGASADDVSEHFSYLVEQLDPVLYGVASSTAERDSKFFDAPAGFLAKVVNAPDHPSAPNALVGVYVKNVAAGFVGWASLYEATSVFTITPLPLVDGFEQRGTAYTPQIVRESEHYISMEGSIVRTDAAQIAMGTIVAYIPPSFVLAREFEDYPCATASVSTTGTSKISLIASNGQVTYYGPSTNWLGFTGVRARLA